MLSMRGDIEGLVSWRLSIQKDGAELDVSNSETVRFVYLRAVLFQLSGMKPSPLESHMPKGCATSEPPECSEMFTM